MTYYHGNILTICNCEVKQRGYSGADPKNEIIDYEADARAQQLREFTKSC